MIQRIEDGKAVEILNKNASQLSNEEVRELCAYLLNIKNPG